MLSIKNIFLSYFSHLMSQQYEYEPAHLIALEMLPLVIEIVSTLRYFSIDLIWANAHMTKSQCTTPVNFLNI